MKILVTGGMGYIGSHTCVELLNDGYEIVVIDDFSNSKPEVEDKIKTITGKDFKFYEGDIKDKKLLNKIFEENKIDAVMHFSGYKAVGESVKKPLMYYDNNLNTTLTLLDVMKEHGCNKFIFSSSATVYGKPHTLPILEDFPLSTTNPYGTTKLMIEMILKDLFIANNDLNITILRYFNPIGAHESGLICVDPAGIPNNLVPYIAKVAVGQLDKLGVFGNDYPTVDGTGVRDYIHVVDLARGHVKALKKIEDKSGLSIYNLGTGHGYSVLQVVEAYGKAAGVAIPYEIKPRRAGDIATCYADCAKAKEELGWVAEYDIERMCVDSYRWQSNNPTGYR